MAEGHIEFTLSLSLSLSLRLFVHVFSCPAHNFVLHGRIQKHCGTNDQHDVSKIHVARSKVKVTFIQT